MKNKQLVNCFVGMLAFASVVTMGEAVQASDSPFTGNVNILYGDKYMSSADWAPIENQEEFGIEVDLAKKEWPIYATFAYSQSKDFESGSFIDAEGKTKAFDLGVKKIWEAAGGFRPFVGTGLTYVRGEAKAINKSVGAEGTADGNGAGYWASGGFGYLIGERFNVGARLKWSSARLKFGYGDGTNVDILGGGLHVGIFTGVHF